MAILSARSLVALLFFAVLFRGKYWRKPNKHTWISGIALMLTQTLFISANKMTTATNAIFLQYVAPIFVILLNRALYKIEPTRREIIALITALAGFALFFAGDLESGGMIGNILAVLAGFTFAVVFLMNHRPYCQIPTSLMIGQAGSFLIGLPFLTSIDIPTVTQIGALLFLGVFQLGMGYALFGAGIRRTKPLNATLITMAEPLASPVWVFLALGERPGTLALIGAAIVLFAIVWLNVGRIRVREKPR